MSTLPVQADKVAQLRGRLGWSQQQLAAKTGVSLGTVRNIEKGKSVRISILQRVCQTLGVLPSHLVRPGVATDLMFEESESRAESFSGREVLASNREQGGRLSFFLSLVNGWMEARQWLGRVAYEMQRGDSPNAKRGDVFGWLAEEMRESDREGSEEEVLQFVERVESVNPPLLRRKSDSFSFFEQSFQNFFAACYIKDHLAGLWYDRPEGQRLSGKVSEAILQKAGQSFAWHETMILASDLIKNESFRTHHEFERCIFGKSFERYAPGEGNIAGVCLLADLAVNPSSGFSRLRRDEAVRHCWRWHQAHTNNREPEQRFTPRDSEVAQHLLNVSAGERRQVLAALVEAMPDVSQLSLRDTRVTDLTPLGRAAQLTWLDLSFTPVVELNPLYGLPNLEKLWMVDRSVETDPALSQLQLKRPKIAINPQ